MVCPSRGGSPHLYCVTHPGKRPSINPSPTVFDTGQAAVTVWVGYACVPRTGVVSGSSQPPTQWPLAFCHRFLAGVRPRGHVAALSSQRPAGVTALTTPSIFKPSQTSWADISSHRRERHAPQALEEDHFFILIFLSSMKRTLVCARTAVI